MSSAASLGDLDDLAFARLLADAAARVSLDLYRDAELLVVTKPDRTQGSEADLAVEAALRRLLRAHRPEQGVHGNQRGAEGSQRIRWLLNPIDATRNFVRGWDWWATRGQGAWTTGPLDPTPRRLQVSRVAELTDAYLAYGDLLTEPWLLELAGRCWRARGIGEFLRWCLLAP